MKTHPPTQLTTHTHAHHSSLKPAHAKFMQPTKTALITKKTEASKNFQKLQFFFPSSPAGNVRRNTALLSSRGEIIRVAALHEKSALKVKITELLLYLGHKMVSV